MRLRRVLLVVGAIALVAVGGFLGWTALLASEYESRLDALRAAGMPVRPIDLRIPPVPDEVNAAPLLQKAHAWYEAHEVEVPRSTSYPRKYWVDDDWEEVEAWLETCAPFLALLEQAAGRPACRYDLRWEDGPGMVVPLIPTLQEATKFLEMRALVSARTPGTRIEAIDSLATILRLADHLRPHCAITHLLRGGLADVAAIALEEVACGPEFDARHARAVLDPLFKAAEDAGGRSQALHGERAMMLHSLNRWISGESPLMIADEFQLEVLEGERPKREWTAEDTLASSWLFRPFAYKDALSFLDLVEESLRLVEDCTPEALAESGTNCEEAKARGVPYLFSALWAPVPVKILRAELRHVATVRLARIGLAVLECRQEEGRWPESLEDLAPRFDGPVPLDPYTGGPLRYERTEDGVRLEAAVPIPVEELREDDEIVWELRGRC